MEPRRREPAPGIFRLVLPLPIPGLDEVNAYLLTDSASATLVDCGIYAPAPERDHGWEDLESAFAATGTAAHVTERLVVTHPHIDHYGMAGRFVETTGSELWMHERSKEELDNYRHPDRAKERMSAMLQDHGVSENEIDEVTAFDDLRIFISEVIDPTNVVSDGDVVVVGGRQWEVIHTPGHSPSHICLWDSTDRILISGDHLLGAITPHIDFRRGEEEDPLGQFLESLERIENLDPALVLPGHGRPFNDGAARARAVLRHHDRRLGSILQVVRNEPHTADEITDEIFGDALLDFQRRLALGEALAHLAYLRKRGEVERFRDDGTYLYRKASRRR